MQIMLVIGFGVIKNPGLKNFRGNRPMPRLLQSPLKKLTADQRQIHLLRINRIHP